MDEDCVDEADDTDVGVEDRLKVHEDIIEALLFLPRKSMSLTGAYCTSFTPVGITQYVCVTVIESLIRTPLSMAKRRDAMCEQDSPSPAIQLQSMGYNNLAIIFSNN